MRSLLRAGLLAGLMAWEQLQGAQALTLDINDKNSIVKANSIVCDNALTFYHGNKPGGIPGIPDGPYYWWEAGGLFGLLIQRWHLTKNDSLNDMVTQGMLFQVGDHDNFEPQNQTKDLGNDDQVFWAFAAMDAAELGFPNPPDKDDPSWLSLAQAVFNRQTERWDPQNCHGGMRWQIVFTNPGYDYKNVMTNGGYFQLAARLARYTGNATYAKYAEKMYDWLASSPLFDNSTGSLQIWDGIHIANCSGAEQLDWTYNPTTLLMGAAYMYDYSKGATIWKTRISTLLKATDVFFVHNNGANSPASQPAPNGNIMAEVACEFTAEQTCNQDEPSFKAYASRWLAMTTVLAPFTKDTIEPRLQASAQGAAAACVGTYGSQHPGTSCGRRWYQTGWDNFYGLGEHMSAMSVFQSLLIGDAEKPLTAATGGKSEGDAGAGNGGSADGTLDDPVYTSPITGADKFGAAVLTIMSISLAVGGGAWMAI